MSRGDNVLRKIGGGQCPGGTMSGGIMSGGTMSVPPFYSLPILISYSLFYQNIRLYM